MLKNIEAAEIVNPKRGADELKEQESRLFPYYAGYSSSFTKKIIGSLGLNEESLILDPWNGSGTTTRIASSLNYRSVGCDLNPAMGVIAKADLLSPLEAPALLPLANEISNQSCKAQWAMAEDDALCQWLCAEGAQVIRSLERQVNKTLISTSNYVYIPALRDFDAVSPLACVMYLALFRMTRRILQQFLGSNPTWVKKPSEPSARLKVGRKQILEAFKGEVTLLASQIASRAVNDCREIGEVHLHQANSSSVPVGGEAVDLILTSPPYCTRIDYAVATSLELAVLGVAGEKFDELRRALLGTSTITEEAKIVPGEDWGETCLKFLSDMKAHASRASSGYYYKNHVQYFSGLRKSVHEMARVLRKDGGWVCIIQDSYYKEIHNDLPLILSEMARAAGFGLARRENFRSSFSMVNVNSKSRKYLKERDTTESVLCFVKN